MQMSGDLLTVAMPAEFMNKLINDFATCIFEKSSCMDNCVGFFDGTVICIARLGGPESNHQLERHLQREQAKTRREILDDHIAGRYVTTSARPGGRPPARNVHKRRVWNGRKSRQDHGCELQAVRGVG